MAVTSSASKLVAKAGREVLRPMGLRQRGRSRLWLDDHDWWLAVVEFGSPRWSQGSRLTIGAMWLWEETPHVRFDVLDPAIAGSDFVDEAQFYKSVRRQCGLAAERVGRYRDAFCDLTSVAEHLASLMPARPTPWDWYHAGVAAGLVGEVARARAAWAQLLEEDADGLPWLVDLQRRTRTLLNLVDDHVAFRAWASEVVAASRRQLKLSPLTTVAFSGAHHSSP
jgi:hypothetical protein